MCNIGIAGSTEGGGLIYTTVYGNHIDVIRKRSAAFPEADSLSHAVTWYAAIIAEARVKLEQVVQVSQPASIRLPGVVNLAGPLTRPPPPKRARHSPPCARRIVMKTRGRRAVDGANKCISEFQDMGQLPNFREPQRRSQRSFREPTRRANTTHTRLALLKPQAP